MFLSVATKCLARSNLWLAGLTLAWLHDMNGMVVRLALAVVQECGAAGHSASSLEKGGNCCSTPFYFPFYSVTNPSHGTVPPIGKLGLRFLS